jgi:hypothetical protein
MSLHSQYRYKGSGQFHVGCASHQVVIAVTALSGDLKSTELRGRYQILSLPVQHWTEQGRATDESSPEVAIKRAILNRLADVRRLDLLFPF